MLCSWPWGTHLPARGLSSVMVTNKAESHSYSDGCSSLPDPSSCPNAISCPHFCALSDLSFAQWSDVHFLQLLENSLGFAFGNFLTRSCLLSCCWCSCCWGLSRRPGCCYLGCAFSIPALDIVTSCVHLLSFFTKGHYPQRRLSFSTSCVRIMSSFWFLL